MFLLGCAGETPLRVPVEAPEVISGEGGLSVSWSNKLAADVDAPKGVFKPAVQGDQIIVASNRGLIRAYSQSEGDTLWTYDVDLKLAAGVSANQDALIVIGRNGEIIALSPEGQFLWQHETEKEILSPASLTSKLAVVQAVDGSVVGLNLKTGEPQWVFSEVIPSLTLRGTGRPFIFKDRVILGFASGKLVALKLSNGEKLWEQVIQKPQGQNEFERVIDLDAAISAKENVLFVPGYQGFFTAIEAYRGQVLWQKQHSSFQGGDFYVDRLYTVNESSHIQVMDYRNGEIQWQSQDYEYRDVLQPKILGDYLVFSDYEGYIHLMDRFSAQTRDRLKLGPAPVRLIVEGESVYGLASNGKLKKIQLQKD